MLVSIRNENQATRSNKPRRLFVPNDLVNRGEWFYAQTERYFDNSSSMGDSETIDN